MELAHYHGHAAGKPVIYFYKKNEPYGFLSQFYARGFEDPDYPGLYFSTAEHHIHYNKAILFEDNERAEEILAVPASQPSKAYLLGQRVRGFNSEVWNKHKERIVYEANHLKFYNPRNADIRQKLLNTKGHMLLNCAPKDSIWGLGLSLEEARVASPLR
ncbi:uncharacterized protein PG998_013013 [Apiospora kogelbergensis]|uniref:uncharacterized protein n=1 Tax=Apiospora kogelbergensis TaxID=1337665 RepID=UPI003131A286